MQPTWKRHWTAGAEVVERTRSGCGQQDTIERLPSGEFIARVWSHDPHTPGGLDFIHGPFPSADAARPCTRSACDCWRREVKERMGAERDRLALIVNQEH